MVNYAYFITDSRNQPIHTVYVLDGGAYTKYGPSGISGSGYTAYDLITADQVGAPRS